MSEELTDEEIIAQERLYELETESGALAGKLGTPDEQMQRIKAFFAEVRARKKLEKSEVEADG